MSGAFLCLFVGYSDVMYGSPLLPEGDLLITHHLILPMSDTEHRGSQRTPFKSRIRITHPIQGTFETVTRDLSDCGVFVLLGDSLLEDGVEVQGQVLDLPGPAAPIVTMKVVRVESEGVGLEFL